MGDWAPAAQVAQGEASLRQKFAKQPFEANIKPLPTPATRSEVVTSRC